jgi:hypothetical protein
MRRLMAHYLNKKAAGKRRLLNKRYDTSKNFLTEASYSYRNSKRLSISHGLVKLLI